MTAVTSALVLAGCSAEQMASTEHRTPHSSSPTTTHREPKPTSTTEIQASDFGAIRTVLAARAHAVLSSDEQAFMATVDRSKPEFYAAQKVMYENLQALPVTSMSYDVGDAGLLNAPGITGGPLLSPEIVEHVFFAGTDQAPVGNAVQETFVRRSGHWLLAADATDTTNTGGDSARPWAGPKIAVVTRGPLIVVADAALAGGAQQLADTVASDLRFDASILDVPVNDHLMVDATSGGSVTKFDNAESAAAVTFAVFAMKDFRASGFAGNRVKVNPDQLAYLNSSPVLLRHELTHYLMFKYSGLNPKWLSEGLAEYVSHQPAGLPSEYMTTQAYDRLMGRPQELTVSGLYGLDPSTDYPLAMACVTYLVDHGGMAKLEELMAAYAAYDDAPYEDSHTAAVLHKVYGLTPSQVAHGAFTLLAALR